MGLVIEDGNIVSGANSWVTVEEFEAYVSIRGVSLDESQKIPAILEGADYVMSQAERFRGELVAPGTQDLCWPRKGAYLYGQSEPFPDNMIPNGIKKAQLEAAMLSLNHDILQNTSEPLVTGESIGPLRTTYATSSIRPWEGASFPLLESILEPFLGGRSLWSSIPVKRAT